MQDVDGSENVTPYGVTFESTPLIVISVTDRMNRTGQVVCGPWVTVESAQKIADMMSANWYVKATVTVTPLPMSVECLS
jgi:hypothetical protein